MNVEDEDQPCEQHLVLGEGHIRIPWFRDQSVGPKYTARHSFNFLPSAKEADNPPRYRAFTSLQTTPPAQHGGTTSPFKSTDDVSRHQRTHLLLLLACESGIVEQILRLLRPAALAAVAASCRAARRAVDSPSLWQSCIARDYPSATRPQRGPPSPSAPSSSRGYKREYCRIAGRQGFYMVGGCAGDLSAVPAVSRVAVCGGGAGRGAEVVAGLGTARIFAAAAEMGGQLYVCGGCTSLSACLRSVEVGPARAPRAT
jgi:hypothetical protein